MSTTTIRLPDELKARIEAAAERTGKSPQTLILEAISEKAELEERRLAFNDEADTRMANFSLTGNTVASADMFQYLEERAAEKSPPRPKPTKTSR